MNNTTTTTTTRNLYRRRSINFNQRDQPNQVAKFNGVRGTFYMLPDCKYFPRTKGVYKAEAFMVTHKSIKFKDKTFKHNSVTPRVVLRKTNFTVVVGYESNPIPDFQIYPTECVWSMAMDYGFIMLDGESEPFTIGDIIHQIMFEELGLNMTVSKSSFFHLYRLVYRNRAKIEFHYQIYLNTKSLIQARGVPKKYYWEQKYVGKGKLSHVRKRRMKKEMNSKVSLHFTDCKSPKWLEFNTFKRGDGITMVKVLEPEYTKIDLVKRNKNFLFAQYKHYGEMGMSDWALVKLE